MNNDNKIDFRNINFGKADAQEEGVEYPKLLTDGYYEVNNVVQKVCCTSIFLILGYKGSGKSALSEHLKLSASDNLYVDQQSLKDFPYKMLSKIVTGDSELEYKLKVSWRWLLLVQILSALRQDHDAQPSNRKQFDELENFLTQSDIYPLGKMSSIVAKSTSRSFRGNIQGWAFSQTTKEKNTQISLEWLIDHVKRVICGFTEMHQHYLVIDGLDDILTSREIQYQSIAALINEVKDLNLYFRQREKPFKIIVLCRTDIFERLPDANKNKIRRDCSFNLSWYIEGEDTQKECGLVDIINLRGRLVYPDVEDVINAFFPSKYHNNDIYSALLEMTRHTPRDFLQLLISIQEHCSSEIVNDRAIEQGVKLYSSEYFLPEIKDEMAGYISYDKIDPIINILSSFREREFLYSEFLASFEELNADKGLNADLVLNVLYECSAIGNTYPYKNGKETRISFKYRNRHSSFVRENRIILHKGLWKALNVNY